MSFRAVVASTVRATSRCHRLPRLNMMNGFARNSLRSQLSTTPNSMLSTESQLITTLSSGGGLNLRVVDLTRVVHEITSQHACSPLASVILGRALVGNTLLAAGREDDASCHLSINGNGPVRGINTEVTFTSERGYVKGYVEYPAVDLPLQDGLLDVSGGVGIGVLEVVRSHASRPEVLQKGSIMLETSEIGDDIVTYLLSSEQINSAMGLGVQIDEQQGHIKSAVGFLCTVLPGCTDEELSVVEKNIGSVTKMNLLVNGKKTVAEILLMLTDKLGEQFRNVTPLVQKCTCSEDKFLQSFKLLGQKELQDIIDKNEKYEKIRCHWCNSETKFAPSALKSLIDVA